jgi:hypothetical protein
MRQYCKQRYEGEPPSWRIERRKILQAAGALLGASAFTSSRRACAQAIRPESVSGTPWHKGQVGFMLSHEQFTVPQLVELGAAAEQAGCNFVAASDHLQP